ncbi:MAG: hypothetical protein HYW01_03320 [Deltaproteobacteria bacterium]|nr:hypothetical protein [Deltaproteobacteria bacterium]
MKKSAKTISLFLTLALATSISLLSCDGGGGGDGQAGGTSTIRGNVADVVTAMAPMGEKSSMLAQLKDLLGFSKTANAQGSEVEGITVIAQQDGNEVDEDITDSNGGFDLTVFGGDDVTLIFVTPTFTVFTVVVVPANAVVIIVVILQPTQVVVQQMQQVLGPIRCEGGIFEFAKAEDTDFVIDGGGEDCIRAEGNCIVNIDPENIILTNCERCIRAEDEAQVTLTTTDGDISCDANEDGIRTKDNATVNLSASGSGDITILAGENGIRAEDTSIVELDATGICTIQGDENAIRQDATATVDTSGCNELNLIGGIRIDEGDEDED